jgi:hypothetical protein
MKRLSGEIAMVLLQVDRVYGVFFWGGGVGRGCSLWCSLKRSKVRLNHYAKLNHYTFEVLVVILRLKFLFLSLTVVAVCVCLCVLCAGVKPNDDGTVPSVVSYAAKWFRR